MHNAFFTLVLVSALTFVPLPAPCEYTHPPVGDSSAIIQRKDVSYAKHHYDWPTKSRARVLRRFDSPAQPWLSGHRGVDLAVSAGSPIFAAESGTVIFAGKLVNRPVISIDHADGLRSTYEPVHPKVEAGVTVAKGELIGYLVPGHRSDGKDALHFGIKKGRKIYLDPLFLLRARIRLYPPFPGYARG